MQVSKAADVAANELTTQTGLRQACLWTAFRQELYIALVEHRPVQWLVPRPAVDIADDWTWALKTLENCGRVTQHVFNSEHRSRDEYNHLASEVRYWRERRPSTFDSLLPERASDEAKGTFPDKPLLGSCHGDTISIQAHDYNASTNIRHSDGLAVQHHGELVAHRAYRATFGGTKSKAGSAYR